MASTRGPGCAKSLLLWAFARVAFAPTAYPHLGIHTGEDRTNARPPNALPLLRPPGGFLAHHGSGALLVTGENRLSWPVGCCEGDLIVIDFRDEQADGNDGSGMLYLNNTYVQSYRIQCAALCPRAHAATACAPESLLPPQASRGRRGQRGYTWKSYGPFCAQEGWHNFTYTSDGNPEETVFTITDSYGLIKAQGGMHDLPVRFYTYAPSKFCVPDEGLTGDQSNKRNNKLFAYHDQFTPRAKLIEEGFGAPQDKWPPLTVFDNEDFTKNVRSWATV